MDILDYIEQIDQQNKAQNFIYHNVAAGFGLSDTAMWVLYSIYASEEPVTQQELCRQYFFPKQTVNSAIAALVKDEYVALEAIPGTRNQKEIRLTQAGSSLALKTIQPLMEAEKRAYAVLSEKELEAYLEMTARLVSALRKETEEL